MSITKLKIKRSQGTGSHSVALFKSVVSCVCKDYGGASSVLWEFGLFCPFCQTKLRFNSILSFLNLWRD